MGCLLKFLVVVDNACPGVVVIDINKHIHKILIVDRFGRFHTSVIITILCVGHAIAEKDVECKIVLT